MKSKQTHTQETDQWLSQAGQRGRMGEGVQKVHSSSYKISPGDVTCNMVSIADNTALYI